MHLGLGLDVEHLLDRKVGFLAKSLCEELNRAIGACGWPVLDQPQLMVGPADTTSSALVRLGQNKPVNISHRRRGANLLACSRCAGPWHICYSALGRARPRQAMTLIPVSPAIDPRKALTHHVIGAFLTWLSPDSAPKKQQHGRHGDRLVQPAVDERLARREALARPAACSGRNSGMTPAPQRLVGRICSGIRALGPVK